LPFAEQRRVRFRGVSGLGETSAVHQAISTSGTYTIQTYYNLINPTAGTQTSEEFPVQDYRRPIDITADNQMGAIAMRALAGETLSGTTHRHPVGNASVSAIVQSVDTKKMWNGQKRLNLLLRRVAPVIW